MDFQFVVKLCAALEGQISSSCPMRLILDDCAKKFKSSLSVKDSLAKR
jgi:hypothetical protein